MKKCSLCGIEQENDEFYKRNDREIGLSSQCRTCERARKIGYAKEYRVKNKEKVYAKERLWRLNNKDKVRNINLKRTYGITLSDYGKMLESQNNKCKICGELHDGSSRETSLHIDHCHSSNKIRGLICMHCNRGLGAFRDNLDYLASAMEYLSN